MGKTLRRTPAMLAVLRCLTSSSEPMWGLRVAKQVNRPTGSVYPILDRLEDAGHVTSRWDDDAERSGPRRRLYQLTDSGSGWAQEQIDAAHTQELRRAQRSVKVQPASGIAFVPCKQGEAIA